MNITYYNRDQRSGNNENFVQSTLCIFLSVNEVECILNIGFGSYY